MNNADLIEEARKLDYPGCVCGPDKACLYHQELTVEMRTLVPQLADALAEADSLATQAGIDAETQYQRALKAEARLAEVREWAMESQDSCGTTWECGLCHLETTGNEHERHLDVCPVRQMEPTDGP